MIKKIIKSLKYIKLADILACITFILVLIPALIYKIYLKIINKKIWVICEDGKEARDNGYHLFKYIITNHKNTPVYYAIKKNSEDYNKIKAYGNIIEFGSLKHWIYYLTAEKNISTHKYGNPNAPLFYFLHISGLLRNKRIFLQHGITKDDAKWLYYKNTKFDLFVCAALKEYNYVKENFGYPEKNVAYLGFPRFDNLDNKSNKKQIVLMPTWRNWLGRETNALTNKIDFINSDYYKQFNSLINNKKIITYLEQENITMYFYPHRNMQKYISQFNTPSKNIKVVGNEVDIQDLLIESSILITDYSSVAFDFAYMKKPVLYYQFDKEQFRKNHLEEGYFSYEDDGFGEVIAKEDKLVNSIINNIKNDYKLSDKYEERVNAFFKLNDKDNSKRNYEMIKSL